MGRFAAWWVLRQLRGCLCTARKLPEASRQWIAPELCARAAMLLARREVDQGQARLLWLEDRLAGDVRMRHLALRDGAKSESDPRWLRAAILESWTTLLICEAKGILSDQKVLAAEEEIARAFNFR